MTNHPASPRAHGRAIASLLPLRLLSPKASGRARASLLPLLSLLSLLSFSSLFPIAARAEDYPLWIAGVQFTSDASFTTSAGTLTKTADGHTLTMPASAVTISATMPIPYVDASGTAQTPVTTYTAVAASATSWTTGWYVVNANTTIDTRIEVTGAVNLILCDGAALTASKGIHLMGTNSLTIWAQTTSESTMGKLTTGTPDESLAGIGGNNGQTGGIFTVNGGSVTVQGGKWAAGIGGGEEGDGCSITIKGGKVTARATTDGAGIGGGRWGGAGTVKITGGSVTANGGGRAAGIGGGCGGAGGTILITGGTVKATGAEAGIGGGAGADGADVTITGGTVTAQSGSDDSEQAIGHGYDYNGTYTLKSGDLTINGMRVTSPAGTLAGERLDKCRANGSVTLKVCGTHTAGEDGLCKWCGSLLGKGTETDPYRIPSAAAWNAMADYAEKNSTTGVYFLQTADITEAVTRQIPTFSGVYDGGGHTLTVAISGEGAAAPFHSINGATIRHLAVTGTVSGGIHCSGLVGGAAGGKNIISDCLIGVSVTSSGTHCGGMLGHGGSYETLFDGCVFTGGISGAGTAGTFWGWSDAGASGGLINCLDLSDSLHPVGRGAGSLSAVNTYYIQSGKITDGDRAWSDHGGQACAVTAGSGVSLGFQPNWTLSTQYSATDLTAGVPGLMRGETVYAAEGDSLKLVLSAPGLSVAGFKASVGTLTETDDGYTLAMPAEDVTVSAIGQPYPLWIAGVQFDSVNLTIDGTDNPEITSGTATYDPASHTLTLTGFFYSGLGYKYNDDSYATSCYKGEDALTIVFSGENSITQTDVSSYGFGLLIDSPDSSTLRTVTFSGAADAVLNLKGGDYGYTSYGIYTEKALLVFSGGKVNATGGSSSVSRSIGLSCSDGCKITVDGGALNAVGGTAGTFSRGITFFSNDGISVISGSLTAIGGTAGTASRGIEGLSDNQTTVTVTGGTLVAQGNTSGIVDASLTAADDLVIFAGADEASAALVAGDGWKDQKCVRVAPFTPISAWVQLYNALKAGGAYRLTADVAPEDAYWGDALVVPAGVSSVLDLNGHIVDRGYRDDSTQFWDGSVVKIEGSLTVLDSDPTAGHNGAADYVDPLDGGTASVTGGILTGGWPDQYGGVYVGAGTFNLQGGTICGNRVGKTSTWGGDGLGAGVYVQSGTFNMSGGAIRFNRAVGESTILGTRMGRGGGVYVSNGTFNFSGGTIAGNEAGQHGGGIYVASTYSGHGAAVNLSGGATVAGNALDGAASNIYLEEGGTIAVAGALSGTAGVTMQTPGVFTSGLPGNGGAANFASDDPALAVSLADDGEAQLGEPAYPLWIGGARFTAGNLVIDADDDPGITSGTATYDPESNTLTLTNFVYGGAGHSWTVEPGTENEHTSAACIFYSGADALAVVLSGTNSVALSASASTPNSSYGFRSDNYGTSVSFAGSGSLSARAGAAENVSKGVDVRGPLAVAAGAEVAGAAGAAPSSGGVAAFGRIEVGGRLAGTGGASSNTSGGIACYTMWTSEIVVSEGASVAAAGGDARLSYGILAKTLTVNGGEATAEGGEATSDSLALSPTSGDFALAVADGWQVLAGEDADGAAPVEGDGWKDQKYVRVSAPPSVSGVEAAASDPWDGTVALSFTVAGDPAAACPAWNAPYLSIVATDNETGSNYVSTVAALTADAAAPAGSNGTHEVVWDMRGALPEGFASTNVTFTVAYLRMPDYCILDLSGGADAAAYPVTYLDGFAVSSVPSVPCVSSVPVTNDLYKTDRLAMRLVAPEADGARPFYCAVFETTQRQWELVTGGRPSYFANETCYATRPVERVSWNAIRGDAATYDWPDELGVDPDSFVGVLRRKSGLAALDLPAEAQWEFACRAGTTAAYNNGSDDQSAMDSLGRHWNNGGSDYSQDCATDAGTAAVGSYQPNAWGLYDMHGNVFEWCLERYSSSGSDRVLRGGSWRSSADYCPSSHRFSLIPSFEYYYGGFRLVRTLSDDPEAERGAEAAAGAARAGTVCAGAGAAVAVRTLKDIAATVTFNGGNGAVAYDGQGHGVTVAVNDPANGAAVLFALGDASGPTNTFSHTEPMFTNACDVTVYVEISAEGYATATNSARVTIEKATYDMSGVKWDYDGAFTYDGTEKNVALTGLPDGVTAEYAGNVATNAGGYIATAELLYDTRNYVEIVAPDPLAWAIEKAVLNGGEEPGSGAVPEGGLSKFDVAEEYDGAAHTVDAEAVLAAFQSVAPGVAVGYALSGDAAEWSAEPESFVNVCETSVWYRVTLDNYEDFVKEVKVSVTPRDIANVSVEPIERIPFKGTAVEPEPVVTDGDPSIVTADDYDVSYRDNDRPGTATLTLTGKNNYTGTKDVEFAIGTAELTAEIAWAYLKATGTYFAQLKVTCTNGLAAGVDDLRFLFADRIGEDGKTEAALWNTPARAANPDTEVRGGETYRRVALDPSLITAENAPVTYGISDLAASPIPVAERVIEMYVHRRVVPEPGNEGAAKVGDFVGYVCWESGGEQKAIPLVADRSRSASIASLSSRASLSSLPSPRLLNVALAVGVPLAEDSSPYCRIGAFSVEGGTIRGRIEVGAAAAATGATLPGSLGANATVTVLGAKSPAGPFTELSAVAVAADGSFSLARPAGAAFFRLRLDIVDAVK